MLKIRVLNISKNELAQDAQEVQGHRLGPEPALQEDLRRRIRPCSAASRYGCLVGDYHFDHSPPDVELLGDMAKVAAAAHCAVHHRRRAHAHQHGELAGAGEPARSDQDLPATPDYAAWSSLREIGGLPLHRPGDAALPGAPALRRQDQPGRGLRLRGRHRAAPTTTNTAWSNAAYAMAREHQPLVQAVWLVLADPRRRVRRCGRRPARATPSPPTTAAWT